MDQLPKRLLKKLLSVLGYDWALVQDSGTSKKVEKRSVGLGPVSQMMKQA